MKGTTMTSETKPLSKWRSNMYGVALACVVVLTAYAAFTSQAASNRVLDLQSSRDAETSCISRVLFTTIQALNQRTQFTTAQALANSDLQRKQAAFISVVLRPEHTPQEGKAALQQYFRALQHFNRLIDKSVSQAIQNPYPEPTDFTNCLADARRK